MSDLIDDLKRLRAAIPAEKEIVNFSENLRNVQNLGGFVLRGGRLDRIIDGLITLQILAGLCEERGYCVSREMIEARDNAKKALTRP
jgi:hypothetical protein